MMSLHMFDCLITIHYYFTMLLFYCFLYYFFLFWWSYFIFSTLVKHFVTLFCERSYIN